MMILIDQRHLTTRGGFIKTALPFEDLASFLAFAACAF